jgi:hypothetical protein
MYYSNLSPLNSDGQNAINSIANIVCDVHGDIGSCVMGMSLSYEGVTIAKQIAQGSLTNEYFFNAIIEYFTERGVANKFKIQWGRMD